jgi:hypothetical protein
VYDSHLDELLLGHLGVGARVLGEHDVDLLEVEPGVEHAAEAEALLGARVKRREQPPVGDDPPEEFARDRGGARPDAPALDHGRVTVVIKDLRERRASDWWTATGAIRRAAHQTQLIKLA